MFLLEVSLRLYPFPVKVSAQIRLSRLVFSVVTKDLEIRGDLANSPNPAKLIQKFLFFDKVHKKQVLNILKKIFIS